MVIEGFCCDTLWNCPSKSFSSHSNNLHIVPPLIVSFHRGLRSLWFSMHPASSEELPAPTSLIVLLMVQYCSWFSESSTCPWIYLSNLERLLDCVLQFSKVCVILLFRQGFVAFVDKWVVGSPLVMCYTAEEGRRSAVRCQGRKKITLVFTKVRHKPGEAAQMEHVNM